MFFNLRSLTTHLICSSPTGRKYEAAVAHNATIATLSSDPNAERYSTRTIRIVSEAWLWECLRQWAWQDESSFEVKLRDVETIFLSAEVVEDLRDNDEQVSTTPVPVPVIASNTINACRTEAPPDVQSSPLNLDSETTHQYTIGDAMAVDAPLLNVDPMRNPSTTSRSPRQAPLLSPKPPVSTSVIPSCSASSSSMTAPQNSPPSSQTSLSLTLSSSSSPPKKIFLLGGGSSSKHENAREVIEGLGGEVITTAGGAYDSQCTHLLLWRFERTEKCMCACAAGKVNLDCLFRKFVLVVLNLTVMRISSFSGFYIRKHT